MKETPDKYIGTYVDFAESDSNNPNDYTWSQFVGDDGIPGTNGENGETSYLHIKYSNDGGTTFTSNNGEDVGLYIGQYVDFVQQDSSTPSKYKWALIKGADGQNGQDGVDGEDGVVYEIISSTNTIKITESNNFLPTSVTFSAIKRIGSSGNTTAYSGRFKIEESTNGSTYTTKYTSSANESSKTWSPSSTDIISIRCSLYLAGGTTTLLDIQSVTILTDVSQLTQQIIFNKLTNNGQLQGLFMQDGNLYINASYLSTGIIADKAGKFSLNMTTGKAILSDGEFSGKITATSGIIGGWTIANSYLNSSAHNSSLNVDFVTKIDASLGNISFTSSNSEYTTNIGIDGIHFETGWSEGDRWVYRDVTYGLDGIKSSGNLAGEDFSLNGHGVQFGPPAASVGWANDGGILRALGNGAISNIRTINGYSIGGGNTGYNNTIIPVIGSDGVMEVSRYIDFHIERSQDYEARLNAGNKLLEVITNDFYSMANLHIGAPGTDLCNLELHGGVGSYARNAYIFLNDTGYIAIGQGDNHIDSTGSRLYLEPASSPYDMFIRPRNNNATTLGTSSKRWYNIYTSRSVNVSSDRRIKENFTDFDDRYIKLVEMLHPIIYKLKSDTLDKSKLGGFIAQDVEDAMLKCGINKKEFGICKYDKESDSYALIYDMFIPLLYNYVQIKQRENDKYINSIIDTSVNTNGEIMQLTQEIKKLQDKLDAFINGNFEIREVNV